MKKLNKLLLIASAAAVPFASTIAQADQKLRLAHHIPVESEQHLAAERFAQRVDELTNGSLEIEILPSGQMGGQREIIESVQLGTLEMGYGESGLYANYVPEYGILTLPYLYSSPENWAAVVDGEIGNELNEKLEQASGLKVLNWILAGYRDTYVNGRVINTPEDFKGLKIRVPESPVFIQTFSTLGAQPTPIPSAEIYTALQTGVVDAMEGTPELAYTFKLFEVAENLSMTRHILFDGSFVINSGVFNGLSETEQNAITTAAKEAATQQRDERAAREQGWLDQLAESGINVNQVDGQAFTDVLIPLQDSFAEKANAVETLKKIRELQ